MATQVAKDKAYMKMAYAIAELSSARRKKVGAILVSSKGYGVIAEGYNGTPSGFDNNCETIQKHEWYFSRSDFTYSCVHCKFSTSNPLRKTTPQCKALVTKPEVLHAESNAITKVARSTSSSHGATLYVTCAPCLECAKLIIQAGIKRVVYAESYRLEDGLNLLDQAGIDVAQHNENYIEILELQCEGFIDPLDESRKGSFA